MTASILKNLGPAMRKQLLVPVLGIAVFGLTMGEGWAVPIVFNLGYGGTVAYGGGATPFTTTDGAVTSVGNGTTTLSISGGDLDFSTGNYTGGTTTSTGFVNEYAAGGFVSIAGDVGGGSGTLLSGSFLDASQFQCCSGTSPTYVSSFSGLLDITYIDPGLAAALNFNLPPTGGSIAQVQIFFGTKPTGPGMAFSGIQSGGAVSATDTAAVPEPATWLLMGAGLVGLAYWGRRNSQPGLM